jgi:tetratricopeptide (TPR) repeat protein
MGTAWSQVRAGSPESQLFDQISSEKNPDSKLTLIESFERQFPNSHILSRVYLTAAQIYRDKGTRDKTIEYGEKVLRLDKTDFTAMMILARNYAMDTNNLDRAVELAQSAVDRLAMSAKDPLPYGYSEQQWKTYIQSNQQSAQQILDYAKAMKARRDSINKQPAPAQTPAQAIPVSTSSANAQAK